MGVDSHANELSHFTNGGSRCHIVSELTYPSQPPNPEIEIHDYAPSSHLRASRKTITEPTGATHILHKPLKFEHGTYSKSSILGFGNICFCLEAESYVIDFL